MRNRTDLELDLATIAQLAEEREDENYSFRAFLVKIDRIVYRLDRTISDQIDCTKCGNCCARLNPSITEVDISRLSDRLKMKSKEIK